MWDVKLGLDCRSGEGWKSQNQICGYYKVYRFSLETPAMKCAESCEKAFLSLEDFTLLFNHC